MLTDDKTALVDKNEFEKIPEYSLTTPTGKTIGKTWRRAEYAPVGPWQGGKPTGRWLLGEFVPNPEPGMVGIKWRELLVVVP